MSSLQKVPPKSSVSPRLPWPLPVEGHEVEVARWWYEPTERRNGGHWCYLVRISFWDERPDQPNAEVTLRGWRVREDYITKQRYDAEIVLGGPEFEVNRKGKRAPKELSQAFAEFISQVREKAEKGRLRYERVMEAQSC